MTKETTAEKRTNKSLGAETGVVTTWLTQAV